MVQYLILISFQFISDTQEMEIEQLELWAVADPWGGGGGGELVPRQITSSDIPFEVVVDYTSCRSREWSNVGREWSNSGREELAFRHVVGIGRGKWVIGLDWAWSGWFDRQWEPTIGIILAVGCDGKREFKGQETLVNI